MKSKIVDNRVHVKRLLYNDIDQYLSEFRGDPYQQYRQAFENARINHVRTEAPLQISLELTSYCNLLCKMCFWNYRKSVPKKNISLALINEIAKQAREIKIPSIWVGAFTEPTLHPEFEMILRELATAHPLDFWMTTNGTLLTKQFSETIVDIPLTKLCVSLDAATPETYKLIRGGDYERVEKNIMQFLDVKQQKNAILPFLRVTFVEMDENKHEIDMFKEKWEGLADVIDVQKRFDFSVMQKDASMISDSEYESFDCIDPYYHLIIKHDGQILPCCLGFYETDSPVYIKDVDLLAYWKSQQLIKFFKTIESKQYVDCCKCCMASIKTQTQS